MKWNQMMGALLVFAAVAALASCAVPQSDGGNSSAAASVSAEASQSAAPIMETAVDFEQIDASAFAEDGTMLLDCTYAKPTFTTAQEAVQKVIQADLDSQIASLLTAREEYIQMSAEEYATVGQKDSYALVDEDGKYTPYYLNLTCTVTRCDETVLSLRFEEYTFTHGAHGGRAIWGCNYDLTTGEPIRFSALGEEFRTAAERLVLEKAKAMEDESKSKGEESPFFPDYADYIKTVVLDGSETIQEVYDYTSDDGEESATLAPTYYFTNEGLVFVSNEYCMQPYAAGVVEFTIPYEDFGDAMNEKFK